MRLALFRVALTVMTLVMTIVVGEVFVRLVAPQPISWLAIYRRHPEMPFFSMLPSTVLHVDTGETEWTVSTDSRGFRVPMTQRPEAGCTALWLGDSFAFGHGVEYKESFVGLIERQTVGVRHINAAVAGYGPTQYRKTLEYLGKQALDFDWVFVASYVGNDFHDTQWDKNSSVADGILGNEANLKSFLKRNLHVYRLLSATYHALADDNQKSHDAVVEQLEHPSAWKEDFLVGANQRYASEMRRIQSYAISEGKQIAFLILPTRDAAAQTYAMRSAESSAKGESSAQSVSKATSGDNEVRPMLPVERARMIFDGMDARYLDLTTVVGAFPAEEMFFRFDGHLTPEGNRLVADAFIDRFDLRCGGPKSGLSFGDHRDQGL